MQKKTGIITHHDVHNHGAHLQLFALSRVLGTLGYDAKALRYRKNYDFMAENASKKYNIGLSSIPTYVKYLIQKGAGRTLYNMKKRNILKKFRENQSLVGEYYSNAKDLDLVVIGSDEIFSIEPGLNPWFFGMGVPCDKVISYAASFGSTTKEFIDKKHAEEFIAAGIKRLSACSVRDMNSQSIVGALSGKDPLIVCDPVILYGYIEEIAKARARMEKKKKKGKYILVYSYDNTMNEKENVAKIKAYAKAKGMKLYSVGFYHKWCDKNINVDPIDIFDWFVNAEEVITDTFHGAVLSIVTNSTVFVKLKPTNRNKLLWLMKEYGLEGRVLDDFSELSKVAESAIDFDKVNAMVAEKRTLSLNYLKEAIKNA